jgi:hypothetical protein
VFRVSCLLFWIEGSWFMDLLPSQQATSQQVSTTFTRKPGTESGPDCLICANLLSTFLYMIEVCCSLRVPPLELFQSSCYLLRFNGFRLREQGLGLRCRAKRQEPNRVPGLLPNSQDQNLFLTLLYLLIFS